MTEAEWLACADPLKMLEFVQGKASEQVSTLRGRLLPPTEGRPDHPTPCQEAKGLCEPLWATAITPGESIERKLDQPC
jgi:hypothetical protein